MPRVFGDGKETIRAGFSTLSLPDILESVMNRTMLAAYQETPIAAFDLCAIGSVSDFKEVSRYRASAVDQSVGKATGRGRAEVRPAATSSGCEGDSE